MVETKSRPCEGRFQSRNPANWLLRSHPPRDPLRDPAALLTQEGNLHIATREVTVAAHPPLRASPSLRQIE
jgi:hypothetical protein